MVGQDAWIAVYIVTNARNGTLYTGVTSMLPGRVRQHKLGTFDGFSKTFAMTGWRIASPGPSAPPSAPILSARRPAMLACPADGYRVTMTLPTAPLSAAWCAAAMSASGYLCTGSPLSSPAVSAAVMAAAAWSSAVISTP